MPVLLRLEKQSLKERRLKVYSLPELNHRRRGVGVGDVGGVFSVIVDAVLCGYAKVWHKRSIAAAWRNVPPQPPPPTCVPVVATAGPRQLCGEAVEEVEDGPGKDHNVVHI